MRSTLGLNNIKRNIEQSLTEELDRCGILYRLFSRVKSEESIKRKIKAKDYKKHEKKITDLIGIRITLYFKDDVDLIYSVLKGKNNFDHESTDVTDVENFKPTRCNLTFQLNQNDSKEVNSLIGDFEDLIATTYEIQIRTVLSEGWHEVEHDLRYKNKADWINHDDLSRNLNGIFATLETSEFSMMQIFHNLTYRHYKNSNVEAMLKSHFRLRFKESNLKPELLILLETNRELLKSILKVDRIKYLKKVINKKVNIPITLDNLVFVVNHFELENNEVHQMANEFIKSELELLN
jgi:ppGpp synthetase/RelA/SpoT-type nucleotidyltranferase